MNCSIDQERWPGAAWRVAPRYLRGTESAGARVDARGMLRPMQGALAVELVNATRRPALFRIRADAPQAMRGFIVEAGQCTVASWSPRAGVPYGVTVRGPGSLVREFHGSLSADGSPLFEAHLDLHGAGHDELVLCVANFGLRTGRVELRDTLREETIVVQVSPDDVFEWRRSPGTLAGGYDYLVTSVDAPSFRWRFAGRLGSTVATLRARVVA